jgi:HD-GYP domain-containing protein (c-di-GMP phosphodiesterase class II)
MSTEILGLRWEYVGAAQIGRQLDSDLVLNHVTVSRQHAEVFITPRGWMVRNLSPTTNGTLLNGLAMDKTPRRLQRDDVVQCGKLQLRVCELVEEQAAPKSSYANASNDIKTTGPIVHLQATSRLSWEQRLHEANRPESQPAAVKQFLTLLQGGYYLARIPSPHSFFQTFLADTLAVMDAQRGAIVLYDDAAQEWRIQAVALAAGLSTGDRCFSKTLAQRCLFKGESILCQGAARESNESLNPLPTPPTECSVDARGDKPSEMASILCILLRTPRRRLGVLHLDRAESQTPFTQEDFAVAEAIAASISVPMESALAVSKQQTALIRPGLGLAQLVLQLADGSLVEHGQRVSQLAGRLALELGLEPEERYDVELAGLLHDLGKSASPLPGETRQSPHSDPEQPAFHAIRGAAALALLPELALLAPVLRAQHEHWDGSGAPDGLTAEAIPRAARILAVADCFDEKQHPETPQTPLADEQALAWLKSRVGADLDPDCVEAFEKIADIRS